LGLGTQPHDLSVHRAEPRWFGIPPLWLLTALAVVAAGLAVALFVVGAWPYALIVLGVAALLAAAVLQLLRGPHAPRTHAARASSWRERTGSVVEQWRVRLAARAELRRIRFALDGLERERVEAFGRLGRAVHSGDQGAETALHRLLADLETREAALRSELDERAGRFDERIQKARLSVADTMLVAPSEPTPPPDEGTPPEPPRIPEPYPPPDEGTPPEPARVPEPGPEPSPRPGE
jgi:hypothetical protein